MSENESTTQDTEGEMREVTRRLFSEHRATPPPSTVEDRLTPERRNLRRLARRLFNPDTDTDTDPEENS